MIDESAFYLVPGLARTYAPRGDRPILRPFLTRDHLSAISGVTPTGHLYTHVSEHAFTNFDVALFVEHLVEQVGGPLLLIWDGSPIHHGPSLNSLLAKIGPDQVLMERLPAYAPELNPDEGVWDYLKQTELPNVSCISLRQLRGTLHRAIMRLRSKPDLILSFFEGAGLSLE